MDYKEILSPCINKCTLDFEKNYCIECMRSVKEKKDWWKYTKEEKIKILSDLKTRKHR